jgi:hypothetical protein
MDLVELASKLPWDKIQSYLVHFGYLSSGAVLASTAMTLEKASFEPAVEALRSFQKFYKIEGGDEAERLLLTLKAFELPRCDFRDLREGESKHVGCAWGLDKEILVYEVENTPEGVPPDQAISAIKIAIKLWNNALSTNGIPLAFKRRESAEKVDVSFAWKVEETEVPFTGTPVARADFPPKCGVLSRTLPRTVVFDAAKPWVPDSSDSNKFNIRSVAAHEIGHILGLPHSEDQGSLMFPALFKKEDPSPKDQKVLQKLYRKHRKRAVPVLPRPEPGIMLS